MFEKKLTYSNCNIHIFSDNNSIVNAVAKADFLISDKNIEKSYKYLFSNKNSYILEPGENSKNLQIANEILEEMQKNNLTRQSKVLGIGGGVVCDLTGFTASLFMRGIEHSFIASTLLAQCDASIGGKTAVNLHNIKNVIGTFKLPSNIYIPINMLLTLKEDEMINGMAELIKIALIADSELYETLLNYSGYNWTKDIDFLQKIVCRSAEIKASIVEQDLYDNSIRRILNFGHTFGHALEATIPIPHGKAVAWGITKALEISNYLGLIPKNTIKEIHKLLRKYFLLEEYDIDIEKIKEYFRKDKKRLVNSIQFIALNEIGSAEIIDLDFKILDSIM